MQRIIFFTKYTSAGASSRYRVYQYLPYFTQAGFTTFVKPFFTDEYLERKFNHKSISKTYILKRYLERIKNVLSLSKSDLVYVEYELLPYFPSWLERWLRFKKVRFVVDYDDAIFHNYDQHGNPLLRKLLSQKIPSVISKATTVITGSEYLTSFAKRFNSNVVEIPTSINIEKYISQKSSARQSTFTIGWIGSPSNSKNVLNILPALEKFFDSYPSRLVLMGFDKKYAGQFEGLPVECFDWLEEDEITFIKSFDIGIMPLEDNLFNRGKCGFKLIQYMASGIPTISTPLQANLNIDRNGLNLFAFDNEEWFSSLEKVYQYLEYYRNNVGSSNLSVAKEYYSIQANHEQFIQIFKKLERNKCAD